MSEQNTRNGNADVFKKAWRGFQGAKWTDEVNVREFIQNNYTQYDGNEDFLAAPTEATDKLWGRLQELQKEEIPFSATAATFISRASQSTSFSISWQTLLSSSAISTFNILVPPCFPQSHIKVIVPRRA